MGMREDFNAAIDSHDASEELEETQQEVLTEDVSDTGVVDTAEVDGETEVIEESVGDAETPTSAEEVTAEPADSDLQAVAEVEAEEKPATESLKAPAGWGPKEREQWSKVPPALQARITEREREMADTMAHTKEARDLQQAFQQMGQSYAPLMASEGFNHPMEAMQAAFGTMTNLRMGTPQQKAQEIARIVGQYGVDIEALDSALVGAEMPQQQQANPHNAQLEQMLDQRMGPVNQLMETVQQAQQQQQQAKLTEANNQVAQFAQKNEFLPDVREDMADIIELAAKRGVELPLQVAYDRAVAAHPEISQIVAQRASDAQIKGQQQSIQQKRAAASSVSGRQTGTGGGGPMSLRDQIADAFDNS